jgi:hypothetical protein
MAAMACLRDATPSAANAFGTGQPRVLEVVPNLFYEKPEENILSTPA